MRPPSAAGFALLFAAAALCGSSGAASADPETSDTLSPIKHVIVFIGENRSFDHLFATYRPRPGQTVANLLSKGIVNEDGSPGANFAATRQSALTGPLPEHYFISAAEKTPYAPFLPEPHLAGAPNLPIGLTQAMADPRFARAPFDDSVSERQLAAIEPFLDAADLRLLRTGSTGAAARRGPDPRIANAAQLPNGVFQITGPTLPYDSYTGDMVHRFFQMWQESDCSRAFATAADPAGCLRDLYPFGGLARGDDSGGNAMGFYNMARGDAPFFKKLADDFTTSDNFHQSAMGGTGANHALLGAGDVLFWTPFAGQTAPPEEMLANPDPRSPGSGAYQRDRAWVSCGDGDQPGVKPILDYLASLPWHPASRCVPGHFYVVNNLNPGFLPNGRIDPSLVAAGVRVPPSNLRMIGDALNEHKVSWTYYGAGYDVAVRIADGAAADKFEIAAAPTYCEQCNFVAYAASIMGDPAERRRHVRDMRDFFTDLAAGRLPAVSFLKPDSFLDGHPASSKLDLLEATLRKLVDTLKARPEAFKDTALFVAFDEGGGYYDTGFIQPLDFFGDGPRIPFIVVSPFSRGGRVVHTYCDHVSILKFIERNWRLAPLTERSRDNLPNPIAQADNPYVPTNMPALGDLFDMFDFGERAERDDDRRL